LGKAWDLVLGQVYGLVLAKLSVLVWVLQLAMLLVLVWEQK
jgi:hypothetical protein